MSCYVYLDVSRKQEFIYKDSKLKENLYNSFVIKAVTERLTEEIEQLDQEILQGLKAVPLQQYLHNNFQNQYCFEYSGGGNSIICFHNKDSAAQFIKGYTFEVLKAYPELELYISMVDESEVKPADGFKDFEIRKELIKRIDELKDFRQSRFKRWSYGIEKIGENGKPVEKEDLKKEMFDENEKIIERYLLKKYIDDLKGAAITVTNKLLDYKDQNDGKSYIGVIAIDGNKMGNMVKRINQFEKLREFSKEINKVYYNSIIEELKEYSKKIKDEKLNFTPILQAGDDICLIVKAEYAIEIAAGIIKRIKENSEKNEILKQYMVQDYLTACAGVAIVRYSYPFFEAVKVSEHLCREAKEMTHLVNKSTGLLRNSFINWEVVQSQVERNLKYEQYVRNRNVKELFHIKPLCVDQDIPAIDGIISYSAFIKIIRSIQREKELISNSFLEGLKRHMYGGIEEYKLFLDTNNENSKILREIIKNMFGSQVNDELFLVGEDKGVKTYTYVINDILEVLPFIAEIEGG